MKKMLSDKILADSLRIHYGIDVTALTLLPLGADMHASVYKGYTEEEQAYFIKVIRAPQRNDNPILELLTANGIDHIIPPLKTLDGKSTLKIEDFTVIIYPFISGQDGFRQPLSDQQWITLGETLRKIHEIDVPQPIKSQIREESYTPKWRSVLREVLSSQATDHIPSELGSKLWSIIKDRLPTLNRLVDRAEQLAAELKSDPQEFVLCHSDIHGGNVLLDEKDSLYIVDWDDPIMAPKERDLMFIGGGVANVWNKQREETLFYQGYGKVPVNQKALAYYRHERIVEDIAIYAQEILFTKTAIENKQQLYDYFVDMFEPNGVVEIAFKTDDG